MNKYKLTLKSHTPGEDFEAYISANSRPDAINKILSSEMSDWYCRDDINRNLELIEDEQAEEYVASLRFNFQHELIEIQREIGIKGIGFNIARVFSNEEIKSLINTLKDEMNE